MSQSMNSFVSSFPAPQILIVSANAAEYGDMVWSALDSGRVVSEPPAQSTSAHNTGSRAGAITIRAGGRGRALQSVCTSLQAPPAREPQRRAGQAKVCERHGPRQRSGILMGFAGADVATD